MYESQLSYFLQKKKLVTFCKSNPELLWDGFLCKQHDRKSWNDSDHWEGSFKVGGFSLTIKKMARKGGISDFGGFPSAKVRAKIPKLQIS